MDIGEACGEEVMELNTAVSQRTDKDDTEAAITDTDLKEREKTKEEARDKGNGATKANTELELIVEEEARDHEREMNIEKAIDKETREEEDREEHNAEAVRTEVENAAGNSPNMIYTTSSCVTLNDILNAITAVNDRLVSVEQALNKYMLYPQSYPLQSTPTSTMYMASGSESTTSWQYSPDDLDLQDLVSAMSEGTTSVMAPQCTSGISAMPQYSSLAGILHTSPATCTSGVPLDTSHAGISHTAQGTSDAGSPPTSIAHTLQDTSAPRTSKSPQSAYIPQCASNTAGETEVMRPALIDELCMKLGLSPNLARVMEKESNSRKNLASKIVRNVFSSHEREISNVRGLKGKKRLNPGRMELVRALTFTLRPLKPGESEEEVWKKECTKAIDSANRKPFKNT